MSEKRWVRWNKLAIASLICGVLNLLNLGTIGSILAICLGYMAAKQIKESEGKLKGLTLALIGIGLGGLGLVGDKFFLRTSYSRYREQARRTVCSTNLYQIGEALYLYAADYNGYFPPELSALYPNYVSNPRMLWCPSDKNAPPSDITGNELDNPNSARISYQYNAGHKEIDPYNTPLLWDNDCEALQGNHYRLNT